MPTRGKANHCRAGRAIQLDVQDSALVEGRVMKILFRVLVLFFGITGIRTSVSFADGWTPQFRGTDNHLFGLSDYTFTTFDPPGSTSTNQLGGGINDAGWIVGSYDDVNGTTHGYLLRDGEYARPLDFPDAILTRVNGINDLGQIVGHYRDADDIQHGFL